MGGGGFDGRGNVSRRLDTRLLRCRRCFLCGTLFSFSSGLELGDDDGGSLRCNDNRLFFRRFCALAKRWLNDRPRRPDRFLLLLHLRLVLAHDDALHARGQLLAGDERLDHLRL